MKINKITMMASAAAMIFATGVTSCMSDLEDGNINPKADKEPNIQGLYSKCYACLIMEGNDGNADFTIEDAGKSTLIRNVYNFNVLPTDEGICWWSDGGVAEEVSLNKVEPGCATLRFLYYRLTTNISYCNQFLAVATDKTMLAEVRFIRAYHYFLMLDFFGDAPFVEKISPDKPKQAHAYHKDYEEGKTYTRAELLKMGREFLFEWIVNELTAAEADMLPAKPETTDEDPNYGRADKGAAWLLLSRLYLNAGTYLNGDGQNNPHWKEAKDYAEKVINSEYKLFTDSIDENGKPKYYAYDLLFMGDNGSNGASCEAILPLLQDGKVTQGWGGSLFMIAALWDPSMKSVTGLTPGTTGNNWSGMRVRREFVEKFTNKPESFVGKTAENIRAMKLDDRALIWGAKDGGEERTLSIGDNSKFLQGLAIVKWNNNYSKKDGYPHDSYFVDTDFFLFRAAEAYLNAAEAIMHLDGENSSVAKGYIDKLRDRARATPHSEYTLNDILDERSREFYAEGVRRTDLIRFNQFGGMQATYSWAGKGGALDNGEYVKGGKFEAYRNVYPLPSSEIQANDNLTQIDGYNE